jgi:hypothetical protein
VHWMATPLCAGWECCCASRSAAQAISQLVVCKTAAAQGPCTVVHHPQCMRRCCWVTVAEACHAMQMASVQLQHWLQSSATRQSCLQPHCTHTVHAAYYLPLTLCR